MKNIPCTSGHGSFWHGYWSNNSTSKSKHGFHVATSNTTQIDKDSGKEIVEEVLRVCVCVCVCVYMCVCVYIYKH